MADELLKITTSGALGVIRFCDGADAAITRGLTEGLVKAGTILKSSMRGVLHSGRPLGRRSGKAAESVAAGVSKQKRGGKALMVYPRESYAWMNAYGFSRNFIQVGGDRQARNINTGVIRELQGRRRARRFEETVYSGGYRRVHELKPRPYAEVVMTRSGDTAQEEIKRAVDFALTWWGKNVS